MKRISTLIIIGIALVATTIILLSTATPVLYQKKLQFVYDISNSGRGFNFQGIARDINGNIIANEPIALRISLFVLGQSPEWQETHNITTDPFGGFALVVGEGSTVTGVFTDLNFAVKEYWIRVELQVSGSWVELTTEKLRSVPYAENIVDFPVGTVIPFAGTPIAAAALEAEGWRICDGTLVSSADFSELYATIGNNWGGDASNFNLPDLRGQFLRGLDERTDGTTQDPDGNSRVARYTGGTGGRNVGSYQIDQFKSHTHTYNNDSYSHRAGGGSNNNNVPKSQDGINTGQTLASGGNETRPKNVYVLYLIKAK